MHNPGLPTYWDRQAQQMRHPGTYENSSASNGRNARRHAARNIHRAQQAIRTADNRVDVMIRFRMDHAQAIERGDLEVTPDGKVRFLNG